MYHSCFELVLESVGKKSLGCRFGIIYFDFFILKSIYFVDSLESSEPGRVAQSVGHLTRKSGVLGSIPGLATYFRFSFRFFKKGSCQLPAKVCARSTG